MAFRRGRTPRYPIDALMATADKTRATLTIALDGVDAAKLINAMGQAVARRSKALRFRHYRDGDVLTAWVERKA